MKKLTCPDFDLIQLLKAILKEKPNHPVVKKFSHKIRVILSKAEKIYEHNAEAGTLHHIHPHRAVYRIISPDEMTKLYNLVLSEENLRKYYDKLKLESSFTPCPYCGHRTISCLDHYLPKSKFPHYTITPINLVPICNDCNSVASKGSGWAIREEQQLVHPYFDDFDDEVWLFAEITCSATIYRVNFDVQRPASWEDKKYKRIKYHFEKLELNYLYTVNAIQEINSRLDIFKQYKDASGENWLKDYFAIEGSSRQNREKNSWQAALYIALSNSQEFCHNIMNFKSG